MLIVSNWKAYVGDFDRAKRLTALAKRLSGKKVDLVLAPPAPFISALARGNRSAVSFAAQDISATIGGAQTGEATAETFASSGATYAIIGHSERRALGETDDVIAQKLGHAVAHGLTPILCVGERVRDEGGKYLSFVREQITNALSARSPKERSKVIVAYEPIWAIGKSSEDAIAPHDLSEMMLYARKILAELLPGKSSSRAKILYGGAVEPQNIRALAGASSVDGFLVGHASVDGKLFAGLVRELS